MMKLTTPNGKASEEVIQSFELENNLKLPVVYREFLKENNGGETEPSLFRISESEGVSVLNSLYGLGDMYENLQDFLEIYDERLPNGFIPIGNDPGGNVICVATKGKQADQVYFWDHEAETEEPNDMANVYFLANDISEFLSNLFEEAEG
ncbi:SMI1/KNR4 family protein [Listeria booriae]|uniref:SMI1/KNR4 family protein n=1 Tax=Listeria booriae TaxID=1552123 RepID=UPI00162A5C4A|nr:SMI1/KNR4 family protein [Listeria booriae]MBC2256677.1 SMI1/KNR4 family protein [Listeria booriae]